MNNICTNNHIRLLIFLVAIVLLSCNEKFAIKNEPKLTTVRVFEDKFIENATAKILIDSLKKYPSDIFIIGKIKLNFCNQQFIDELSSYLNDKTICAEIRSGTESMRLIYQKTNISEEVNMLLDRIKKECK